MRLPEALYRPGGLVREISLLNEEVLASGTGTGVTAFLTNTNINYAWILTNLSLVATPAGAEFVNRMRFRLFTPLVDAVPLDYFIKADETDGAAAAIRSIDWQGEILLLPGWGVKGEANKSAGVSNMDLDFAVLGYQFPAGNFVR